MVCELNAPDFVSVTNLKFIAIAAVSSIFFSMICLWCHLRLLTNVSFAMPWIDNNKQQKNVCD